MELQGLVLKYIRSYEKSRNGGGGIGENLKNKAPVVKIKSGTESLNDYDIKTMFDGKTNELKRGRFLYKNWGQGLLRDLLFFAVPSMKRSILEQLRDEERLKECVEFAWDIRCTEASFPLDRIPSPDKRELFDKLRDEYPVKGSRLDPLLDVLSQGWINWAEWGHFSVSITKGEPGEDGAIVPTITVTYKTGGRTGVVPKDIIADDDWTICGLKNNHSLTSAHLLSASGETYTIKSLFPHFFRQKLKRCNSEAGLASAIEGAPTKFGKGGADGGTGGTHGMALPVGVPSLEECGLATKAEQCDLASK